MSINEENLSPIVLFEQNTHTKNEPSKLNEEQLKKYEAWKIQAGMAQIKLEYVGRVDRRKDWIYLSKVYRFRS